MKRLNLYFLFLIVCQQLCLAQPSTFLKIYNQGECGNAVREVNGNTYVVAGGTDYYYNFHLNLMSSIANTNVHLFKTTSNGNLVWEKIYTSLNHRMIATWMEPVNDGGVIITGHTNNETIWPPDSNDIILIKADINGAISWAKTFDTGTDDLGFCVRQTNDDGFIISGFHDAVPTSLVGNTYALLIKTDEFGTILWEKKYQITVRDLDTGEGLPILVSQTSDGGYIVTGTTASTYAADVFIFRTDAVGNLLWCNSYDHDASFFRFSLGLDIIESQAGDIIVAGAMDKNRITDQVNYPYFLRVNSVGGFINAKIFSTIPDQLFQSGFSSVEQTFDGGFFFTGMGGYSGFGFQAQFVKTDANLNTLWSRVYTMDGLTTMGSRSGRRSSDGCYLFAGKRQMAGTVLMKTDNAGLIPCKTPGSLIEIIPSINVVNHTPSTISGINATNLILNTQVAFTDTATVCPVEILSLPVELISFTASIINTQKVNLNWTTSSEMNSDFFEIERSVDGVNFSKLGKIKAAGNSTAMIKYSFDDIQLPGNETLYYRLQQVDFNGDVHFSESISLKFIETPFSLLQIVTDFNNQSLNCYFDNSKASNFQFSLLDITGRLIRNGNIFKPLNSKIVDLNVGSLSHGTYFLRFQEGSKMVVFRLFY